MTFVNMRFLPGQEVILLDKNGQYECRGKVVGRYASDVNLYDIQPSRSESMVKRIHAVPETQLRNVAKPILAYERGPLPGPKHILDEA